MLITQSFGSAGNTVNSIYKHAEIMDPLPAGPEITYEERSFTVFDTGSGGRGSKKLNLFIKICVFTFMFTLQAPSKYSLFDALHL